MKRIIRVKGDIKRRMLQQLKDGPVDAFDLMRAFLSLGYGAGIGSVDRKIREYREERFKDEEEREVFLKMRQRFYNFKNALKRDGLVEEDKDGKVHLLTKGNFKLKDLDQRKKDRLPKAEYSTGEGSRTIIVIFDIPEEKRRKRAWLRATLKNLGLEMEQQSVWMGSVKIPRDFLEDLDRFGLLEYIQIFEVKKFGTLR